MKLQLEITRLAKCNVTIGNAKIINCVQSGNWQMNSEIVMLSAKRPQSLQVTELVTRRLGASFIQVSSSDKDV